MARNEAEAVRFYRLAAKQGYAGAMFNFAKALCDGTGWEKDPVLAVQWMRRAAELGYTTAQGQLGHWYMEGEGSPLPVNYKEALRLSRLAAGKGHATALGNFGTLFASGLGVPRDLDEACRLFRQAITLGCESAEDKLRDLAREGHAPSLAAVRELGLGPL